MNELDRFAVEYQQYRNLSLKRTRQQQVSLRAFASFIDRPLLSAESEDLQRYLKNLLDDGKAPGTLRKERGMIQIFYRWACSAELIGDRQREALCSVPLPVRVEKALPRPYSRVELKRFWDELDRRFPLATPGTVKNWLRGDRNWGRAGKPSMGRHMVHAQVRAIVALALGAGLRHEEIFKVDVLDVHPDNEYIAVAGKGGKPREVPHCAFTRQAIGDWLELREPIWSEDNQLWLTLRGARVLRGVPIIRFRTFEKQIKLVGDEWTMHRFRHTAGTEWLRAGMPLEQVSVFLGHSDIKTTRIYAQVLREDVARSVGKVEEDFMAAVTPQAA